MEHRQPNTTSVADRLSDGATAIDLQVASFLSLSETSSGILPYGLDGMWATYRASACPDMSC